MHLTFFFLNGLHQQLNENYNLSFLRAIRGRVNKFTKAVAVATFFYTLVKDAVKISRKVLPVDRKQKSKPLKMSVTGSPRAVYAKSLGDKDERYTYI